MPRALAIDWTPTSLRYVVASYSSSAVHVEAAGVVASPEGTPTLSPVERAARLKSELAAHSAGRLDAIVTFGRGDVETLRFDIPPAEPAMIPVIVANKMLSEFPNLGDQAAIDYLLEEARTSDGQRSSQRVTALALPAEQLEAIKTLARDAGLKLSRIVPRTYAASSLAVRQVPDVRESGIVLARNGSEVDLIVRDNGQPVMTRSFRAPDDKAASADHIFAEVSRTLAVAIAEYPGLAENPVVALFDGSDADELAARLQSEAAVDMRLISPPPGFSASQQSDWPSIAPLFGALWDEFEKTTPAIDFLHPKQPPPAPNRFRQARTAAVAGVAVVGVLAWLIFDSRAEAQARVDELTQELKGIEADIKRRDGATRLATSIHAWQRGSVNWLDELQRLSERFPEGRDMTVLRLSMSPSRAGGGAITLQGLARTADAVQNMEQAVRDDRHEIQTPRVQERPQDKSFAWHFETSIDVLPEAPASDRKAALSKSRSKLADAAKASSAPSGSSKEAQRP